MYTDATDGTRNDWTRSLTRRGDLANLRAEIARLRRDNDDLRASAECWLRLYEGAIERVVQLELQLRAAAAQHEVT